ncbi:hypothetical protein AB205_0059520 [Aquarana catesbeiana]|uniref:Uncharacterized protein n=1 Tax=Aquarana catesbeiana TaxID=8400 RepID=A0A2G9RGV3_AQUCT|nr:hypothetical protein AB205_0059520 [Aquarana catesbeiana]
MRALRVQQLFDDYKVASIYIHFAHRETNSHFSSIAKGRNLQQLLTKIQKIIKNIYTFPFRQIHLFIYTNHIYTFCIPKNNIAGYTAKNI